MRIAFVLEEIVVVSFLRQILQVVVLAVVTDLFDHCTNCLFVFPNKLCVFFLFVSQDLVQALFSDQGTL